MSTREDFDKAYMIALLDGREPTTAEVLWFEADTPKDATEESVLMSLEALVTEGLVERTEHPTYCSKCESDRGNEFRYALKATDGD